ncbi:protein DEK [Cyprinodon tularosa]|uniref:protein DEK n=1 Tax=Cyprinodon tularosa TaxID=77115 RepID=UPI0018E21227|nr:protein DEK [Cyprinodon tularosa]XP_038137136.1 protein DEK [Cyprinodon tularosa]XP_038137137.1 protein DEK [Cyprinodon tularosa]
MSDVAEEAMDSSAVSEDEVDDPQRDESVPPKSSQISDVGEIVEGKRAKKTVERLDFQAPKAKEKLKILDGGGDKLGDIPRTNYEINRRKADELKLLHSILFDRPGKSASVKKNLRLFSGFPFDADGPEFTKKREKMIRNSNLTNTKLKLICTVLDLEKKGTHVDLIDRILNFLMAPKSSGKRAPVKKKRKSKKKLSGDDSKTKSKKSKPKAKSSSSSSKKSKTGSKSKAIVMDSSSDEDEEDEEKVGASADAEGSDEEERPSEQEEDQEEQSGQSGESEEEDQEDSESSKTKSSKGKKKRQRPPTKKTGPPKKRAKKETSEESGGDSDAEEKPKKKKAAAAKTKKADSSSSNRKNSTNTAEDSSDDDEPLIKMIKKAPTDEQLKGTVEKLLKEANLEEMTMKQICQKVFDTYPEHDLSSRKDFIKQTVKTLIT